MPDLVDVYNAVPDLYCFDKFRCALHTLKKMFLCRVRTMMRFFQEALGHLFFHAGSAKK